jgi:hypothetical protein
MFALSRIVCFLRQRCAPGGRFPCGLALRSHLFFPFRLPRPRKPYNCDDGESIASWRLSLLLAEEKIVEAAAALQCVDRATQRCGRRPTPPGRFPAAALRALNRAQRLEILGGTVRPSTLAVFVFSAVINPRRVLYRQVGRLLTIEDAIDVACREAELIPSIGSVGDQAAASDKKTIG